jgi:hypothetical protein
MPSDFACASTANSSLVFEGPKGHPELKTVVPLDVLLDNSLDIGSKLNDSVLELCYRAIQHRL